MKLGAIVRCDDRGLGNMTWEFWRHVEPDRTLVVIEPGAEAKGFAQHVGRYPGATVVRFDDGHLPGDVVSEWLAGLDVLYSAETFYDPRMVGWCRQLGVRTVLHVMPEFWRDDLPRPDAVWAPTTWRLHTLPADTRLVPVPVALDRLDTRPRERADRFLHVVGHHAAHDRAGTHPLLRALRYVREKLQVRIVTQDDHLPSMRSTGRAQVEWVTGSTVDYWTLYDDADVLIAPRRYGGLSLPWNEAAGAGLALVLPNVPPNRETWPGVYVEAFPHGSLRTAGGEVITYETAVPELAATLDRLVREPGTVHDLSCASIAWAHEHSWEALLPTYLVELERAASG